MDEHITAALSELTAAVDCLPQVERRRARNLINRAASDDPDSWRSILVELMDELDMPGWSTTLLALAYLVDERYTGRLKAWRARTGAPTAQQQARLRMLWLVLALDDLLPQAGVLAAMHVESRSRSNRYGFDLIDLLRQGRYELIAELAAKSLARSSSLA